MEYKNNNISDEELAAYLDGNATSDEISKVISALGNNSEVSEILALSAKIDSDVAEENVKLLPMLSLAAANQEKLCSFECETFILGHLNYDVDHWSLLEVAKANNWVREGGTPLYCVGRLLELKGMHVERKYDTTIKQLEKAVDSGKHVIVVVDKNVIDGRNGTEPPSYHAIYVTWVENGDVEYLNLETLLDAYIKRDTFLKAWKCSGNYMVAASKEVDKYNPQPINVEDVDLDENLLELTEAIAENAHDIWARARVDEGWTYGDVRNDELKLHPDLVPYALLSDSEKEYDRIMAMNTLRLVRRLGFDIVNRKVK
jgi:hypothetical protein